MLSLKIVSGAALAVMALVVAPGAIAQPKDNAVNNTQGNWAVRCLPVKTAAWVNHI